MKALSLVVAGILIVFGSAVVMSETAHAYDCSTDWGEVWSDKAMACHIRTKPVQPKKPASHSCSTIARYTNGTVVCYRKGGSPAYRIR